MNPLEEIPDEGREEFDFNRQNKKDDGQYKGLYEHNRMGPLIKQARQALGLTQKELADRCGISEARISEIETNASEARISTIRMIVEVGLHGRLEFTIHI